MKANQMSDGERKTYAWLVDETKSELKRHRCKVIIASTVVFLAVLGVMIWYVIMRTVAYGTSFSIGGQLYTLYGALLLALGAVSSPSTLGLISMARWDGNSKLFAELMKSRFSALVGISFIMCGFTIQALAMLSFGS